MQRATNFSKAHFSLEDAFWVIFLFEDHFAWSGFLHSWWDAETTSDQEQGPCWNSCLESTLAARPAGLPQPQCTNGSERLAMGAGTSGHFWKREQSLATALLFAGVDLILAWRWA
jgi:hypothetical protein